MTQIQLSSLQQDYQELLAYISECETKKPHLVTKLRKKLDFLGEKIAGDLVS